MVSGSALSTTLCTFAIPFRTMVTPTMPIAKMANAPRKILIQ